MKQILIFIFTLVCTIGYASNQALWLRYPSISPDGKEICFTYQGDIYTIGINGGIAKQITTNIAHDTNPIWSKNGQSIAFASNRMGSYDIFLVSKEGGTPNRLTTNSGAEHPITFMGNDTILFQANIMPSKEDAQFPSGIFSQVYKIATAGGRPEQFSSMPMENIYFSKDGKTILYNDKKGYEDPWRKHHKSSITRDIWKANKTENDRLTNFTKLTDFYGEDRNPIFSPDEKSFFYLSEENGSFNIFQKDIQTSKATQITHHKNHPIRFLSIAQNGSLSYGFDGEIYTLDQDNNEWKSNKVDIKIIKDETDKDNIKSIHSSGASQIALSPDEKEIAFILKGDIYVTSVEYKTTKQITNTPEQERTVSFSPDGRSLVYASERDGLWQIYESKILRKEDKLFCYSAEIEETKLTNSAITSFQPLYSPDGKEVAFLEDRTAIMVINLKSKKVRKLMDKNFEYSYTDGDQWYQWSPDSKWILTNYIGIGGWNNKDMALIKADGNGEKRNLTESGYSDVGGSFVLDGKAMMWFSDRAGYRSHGSWGSHGDIYLMFLDLGAYEKFRMTKEELSLLTEKEKAEKEEKEEKEKSKKKKKIDPLVFDLENHQDRIIRLTVNSSSIGDAVLTPKGDKLYYTTKFEKGYDLWVQDLKEHSTKLLLKGVGAGQLISNKKGTDIYLANNGSINKINITNNKITPISFEATFEYKPEAEREYIFDHIWRQVQDKFYVEDLHNIDWELYKETYNKFLPHINNNKDYAEMLSELLGELNGSHTGARYYAKGASLSTANLGLFYDETYDGNGLKIAEIIKKSPLDLIKTKIKAGCIIEAIDGQKILKNQDYYPLLEGKTGKEIRLSIYDPSTKERYEEIIKGIDSAYLSSLLYSRWTKRCANIVDSLSGGKLGYVHIKGMDSKSFRVLYSELLGKYRNKEAVIIDTRHNGGGWLHDDIVTLLSGKEYQKFVSRGQYIGSDPFNKWLKPSCMLICEDNYSNAHGTPWVYKEFNIGKLIGTPVPGTMTAVWWERQIDPSIVFGIPQLGCVDMEGNYAENNELQPDILIYNKPEESINGRDAQLEKAVEHMLDEIKK